MKRLIGLLSLGTAALLAGCSSEPTAPGLAPSATAALTSKVPKPGAHFLSVGAMLDGTDLVVTFREAGLGVGDVTESAMATATALYACRNNGGQFPNDPKKQLLSGPVSATGTFPVAKNGSVIGSLTLSIPASTLVCPNGQHVVLASFGYTEVSITDVTNAVSEAIAGDFSGVFYDVP